MFDHNPKKYDFWPIYDAIKTYYPIGFPQPDSEWSFYWDYPGWKRLTTILVENIHDPTNLAERWGSFEQYVQAMIGKPVRGTTFAMSPSFSAYAELQRSEQGNRVVVSELYFSVSLLGPFFTIVGRDRTLIALHENHHIHVTDYLTISPENEYAGPFRQLCDAIRTRFAQYRFVPFHVLNQPLEWLALPYVDQKSIKTCHAVFGNQLELSAAKVGDEFYGYDE